MLGLDTMHKTVAQVFTVVKVNVHKQVDKCTGPLKTKQPTLQYGKLPPKSVEVRPWFEIAVNSSGSSGKKELRALAIIATQTRVIDILPGRVVTSIESAF